MASIPVGISKTIKPLNPATSEEGIEKINYPTTQLYCWPCIKSRIYLYFITHFNNMLFPTTLFLLSLSTFTLAQETWKITFYTSGDCSGASTASIGKPVDQMGCVGPIDPPPASAYFDFENSNGNGFGNFYALPTTEVCGSGTEDIGTCYAPSASGCWYLLTNGNPYYTFDGVSGDGSCVVLPPGKRSHPRNLTLPG